MLCMEEEVDEEADGIEKLHGEVCSLENIEFLFGMKEKNWN